MSVCIKEREGEGGREKKKISSFTLNVLSYIRFGRVLEYDFAINEAYKYPNTVMKSKIRIRACRICGPIRDIVVDVSIRTLIAESICVCFEK